MTTTDPAYYNPEPFKRGTPWTFTCRWLADDVPVDLSLATVHFSVVWNATREYGAGEFNKDFTGFDSSGEIVIELTAEETENFPPSGVSEAGAYMRYQLAVNDTVILDGMLSVRRNLYQETLD